MLLGQHEVVNHPLLAPLLALQQAGQYTQAGELLAGHDTYFYDQVDIKVFYRLLANFPQALIKQTPELCYLQALLLRRTGQHQQAMPLLEKAKVAYAAAGQYEGVVCCCLELARLAQQREDWSAFRRYLHDEIHPLLEHRLSKARTLQAHYYLQMADCALGHGELSISISYAQQALSAYTNQGQPYGQLLARLWLATNALGAGKYAEVRSHLQHAHQQVASANLGALAEARLLYVQLLFAWYQREFVDALQFAQRYLAVADAEPYSQERILARLMLGNLYRDTGQYRTAHGWYEKAKDMIEQMGNQGDLLRLQAEIGWLYLLEGQLSFAHIAVGDDYQQARSQQRMKLQVVRAVLYMLDGEWKQADRLLYEALDFYKQVGDFVAVCALRLYLAYSVLHQAMPTQILHQIEQGFGWLAAQRIAAFPDWWHPKILAEVCTHALLSDLYPEVAETMLVNYLGKASLPALALLEKTGDFELSRKALRLQQMISGFAVTSLAHLRDGPSRQVIQELLEHGDLRAESYPQLEHELMTAQSRQHPNPTIIAVFGLYLRGWPRLVIAQKLCCSLENVRNYITLIYQHFALPAQHFPSREVRKQKLVEVARARGFIY